jgi:ATPase subunit of ABC transporter with duplicated ATPase domains
LQELANELAHHPGQSDLQQEYDATLARIEAAAESQGSAPAMLAAFELDLLPDDLPVASLSGGQKTRLGLAGMLLSAPQLLLLDEPTNHLDFRMLEWLEDWIRQSRTAILLVSHDRVFLDNTVETILELDGSSHQLKSYPGNYSDYLDTKAEERARNWQEYTDQQDEIQRLKSAASHYREIARFRKGGKADTGDKFAKAFFANRGLATVKRARSVEKRIEHLLTDEKIDKPRDSWQMKMEFEGTPSSSRLVLALDHLTIGYGDLALLSDLELAVRFGERVVLIGPNGSGKSTLLRTIRGQIPPLAGNVRLGASVRPRYMAQEQEDLDPNLTVLETIQRAAALNETNARICCTSTFSPGMTHFCL